jgi:glutamate/tyrosine decarboxylase-like PLP-dependent enzyme
MPIELPQSGTPWPELRDRMIEMGSRDVAWRTGRAAVYVFNAGPEIEQVQKDAYTLFMSENGLGPSAFPSLRDMEATVVGYGLSLLNAPEGAAGNMTSGGTDSITMAIKAARDFARAEKGLVGKANIVLPFSAHPAFDKAALLMDIDVRRTPLKDHLADPAAMDAASDASTIMVVGSAPCFPYGLIDPITALGRLAETRDLWLHVDACVGGYIAPFARMNGADIAPFDFAVPGVRSMSADLHKYGYCAKGASTVFFRSEALRRYMTFDCNAWPGGRMVTPTLAGTRPGGAIAAAWAVMNFLGVEGYRAKQAQVTAAREKIARGARALGFEVVGAPQLGLLALTRPGIDLNGLWSRLHSRGWFTSVATDPPALHLMLSPIHAEVADAYLVDLAWAQENSERTEVDEVTPRYGA